MRWKKTVERKGWKKRVKWEGLSQREEIYKDLGVENWGNTIVLHFVPKYYENKVLSQVQLS